MDLGAKRVRASEVAQVNDSFVDELTGGSISCPHDCQLRTFCSLFAVAVRASAAELGWRSVGDSIRPFVVQPSASEVERSSAVCNASRLIALRIASHMRSVEARGHEWTSVLAIARRSSSGCGVICARRPFAHAPLPVDGRQRRRGAVDACPYARQ